jgi:hypothetical protein
MFWALALIVGGSLLLLNNLNIISIGWGAIWALFLIALGAWFLWGALVAPRQPIEMQDASIPLGSAGRAYVKIEHGAGTLKLAGGAPADCLMVGRFGGGLDYRTNQDGDTLEAKLSIASRSWFLGPWSWGVGLNWDVQLNNAVPLRLRVEAGASQTDLDLTDLKVTELKLSTGASATTVILPAHAGLTTAKIEAGAASVKVNVPGGVAARIRAKGGLASIDIDETRFPRFGDEYRSPDYDTAANKVEMRIETGVGSVRVS